MFVLLEVAGAIFCLLGFFLAPMVSDVSSSAEALMKPTSTIDDATRENEQPKRVPSERLVSRLSTAANKSSARIEKSTIFPTRKVPVFHMNLYLFKESRKFVKHCELDGLKHSKYLKLVTDPFSASSATRNEEHWVWMGSLWTSMPRVCESFSKLIAQLQRFRRQHGLSTKWPIHMMDWSDEGSTLLRCEQVEHVMGKDYVYYHKRSMVVGRTWNATTHTIDVGQWQTFSDWSSYSAESVQHIPITVRSDFVQAIEMFARDQLHLEFSSENELTDVLVHMNRTLDVVHFWPAPNDALSRGKVDNRKRAQLRNAVSMALQELRHQTNPRILAFAGLKGQAKDQGREQVQTKYLQEMLKYKIVVVAQKDGWEDHYRLFEALVSGALVLSDFMLSLPAGLQDGLVFYQNMDELKELIIHYLQNTRERREIAKRGRRVALSLHRSWHWMERVVIGKAMSDA